MSTDHYKNDLSVNDALALLLGLDLDRIRRGGFDYLLDEIEADLAYAASSVEEAIESGVEEKIELAEERADKVAKLYGDAIALHTKLVGEIAKARRNLSALLVITRDGSPPAADYSDVYISRQSLFDWAQAALDPNPLSSMTSSTEVQSDAGSATGSEKFTALDKQKLLITIALLLELVEKEHGPGYSTAGGPNYSKIADDIHTLFKGVDLKGHSTETLKDRFAKAMRTRREILEKRN